MDGAAPCRFFQSPQGCFRGASCSFRHDPLPGADAGGESSTDGPGASVGASTGNPYVSSARPCRFFTSGMGCRNGSSCPFAHIPAAPAVGNAYGSSMEDPLSSEFGGPAGAMAVNSGGAVYYNHPGMPPPMMMVMPDQASLQTEDANGGDTPTSDGADTSAPAPRRRLKIQANPQKKNHEVISEIMPVFTRDIEGPFFAIDVECVATGTGTNDRDVARIAVVDEEENVVFDQYVKPEKKIVSYLTQLTGITESDLVNASNLNEALVKLRSILPKESVIVGQSIKKDLEWLTLEKAADYRQMFDVADLFRLPMQSTNGTIRYRYFSLRHVAKYLLGHNIQEADHDPVIDAKYAMKVFKQFRYLHESPGHRDAVYQTLLKTPRTPSFAERYPVIDGVSMRAPRKPGTSPSIRNAQGSRHSTGDGASQNQYGSYTQQYHKSSLLL